MDKCAREVCDHFMVWHCLGGYSIYRCSNCDYFDGKKTFADIERELADLKALVSGLCVNIETLKEPMKSAIVSTDTYKMVKQACTLAKGDSKEVE